MTIHINKIALATTENVFAGGYTKSQTVNQVNECGNGEQPLNVLCDNTNSQGQGDDNIVGLTGAQQGGGATGLGQVE
jgi:hypothetical protein